ncbi:hypothetical protein DPMN_111954 [Dreissena polymorpha]|uniref:Uncharacterized protein n=1 Tax=Dreissena polymorpha TaxID=45954 RepID=A0A9D4QPA9_DREPO|nr:hypothetical protein DPMN_111954 [Dreissena polymorpha]
MERRSDASSTGLAGYEVEMQSGVVHDTWSPSEAAKSSTWRELCAVYRRYGSEVDGLPEVLAEKVSLLPELLKVTSVTKGASIDGVVGQSTLIGVAAFIVAYEEGLV